MTADMLGGAGQDVCGTLSSGGTESIMLAMKTYRDWALAKKGITKPEMIVPVTAHAAFDKASQYFNIKMIHIPVDENFRADVNAAKKAITKNTIVIVGSAPSFPHGAIDPIEELSELARQHGIGFHTDACLGGFVLPWAEKLGYPVPPFDFRLPGVTSMSADTHKYGYAAKGTSVVLYRGQELRHFQYYTSTEWPGGLVFLADLCGQPSRGFERGLLGCADRHRRGRVHVSDEENPRNSGSHQEGRERNPRVARARRPALRRRVCLRDGQCLQGAGLHVPQKVEPERSAQADLRSPVRHPASHPAWRCRAFPRGLARGGGACQGAPRRERLDGSRLRHGGDFAHARHGQ